MVFLEMPNKNKVYQPLARLIKRQRESTTETINIKKRVRIYYEQFYANKFDNLDKVNTFTQNNGLPKLTWKQILKT